MTPLGSLIHDTNSALGDIHFQIQNLVKWNESNAQILRDNGLPSSSTPYVVIEYLKFRKKQIQDIIDKYYQIQKEKGEKLF